MSRSRTAMISAAIFTAAVALGALTAAMTSADRPDRGNPVGREDAPTSTRPTTASTSPVEPSPSASVTTRHPPGRSSRTERGVPDRGHDEREDESGRRRGQGDEPGREHPHDDEGD